VPTNAWIRTPLICPYMIETQSPMRQTKPPIASMSAVKFASALFICFGTMLPSGDRKREGRGRTRFGELANNRLRCLGRLHPKAKNDSGRLVPVAGNPPQHRKAPNRRLEAFCFFHDFGRDPQDYCSRARR
jgi:hypothetical protein